MADEDPPVLRCPECRTRRKGGLLMAQHRLGCIRPVCDCGGYHYKHRPESPYCYSNPRAPLRHAERAGASPEQLADLVIDMALAGELQTTGTAECPF